MSEYIVRYTLDEGNGEGQVRKSEGSFTLDEAKKVFREYINKNKFDYVCLLFIEDYKDPMIIDEFRTNIVEQQCIGLGSI